jgi:hypothetical protein
MRDLLDPFARFHDYPSHTRRGDAELVSLHKLGRLALYIGPGVVPVMTNRLDHLDPMLELVAQARGDVLLSGLGIGCALHALLAIPEVDTITVVEKSADVIGIISPAFPELATGNGRLIHGEALAVKWASVFDVAYHDTAPEPMPGGGEARRTAYLEHFAPIVRGWQGVR